MLWFPCGCKFFITRGKINTVWRIRQRCAPETLSENEARSSVGYERRSTANSHYRIACSGFRWSRQWQLEARCFTRTQETGHQVGSRASQSNSSSQSRNCDLTFGSNLRREVFFLTVCLHSAIQHTHTFNSHFFLTTLYITLASIRFQYCSHRPVLPPENYESDSHDCRGPEMGYLFIIIIPLSVFDLDFRKYCWWYAFASPCTLFLARIKLIWTLTDKYPTLGSNPVNSNPLHSIMTELIHQDGSWQKIDDSLMCPNCPFKSAE